MTTPALPPDGCGCHTICSCDLGLSVGAWRCRRHENAHCSECAPVAGRDPAGGDHT